MISLLVPLPSFQLAFQMSEFDSSHPAPPDPPQPRQHLSARVPEHVSRGVFSTGVLVMTGPNEFVLDFIQNLGGPALVAARVVMPSTTVGQFIKALETNLDLYKNRFGEPPELPRPPQPAKKPSVQQIYDDLKVSDEVMVGSYANGVMIGHGAAEFKFDFLANLVPQPAVSCRVYLAAPQVPRLLESLIKTHEEWQRRMREQQERTQEPPEDEGE
jgi:hypothetical protein